ncbi:MAG: tRNA pseudouridine(38-40) synthase TruA [Bryobacterales bacterium]|nr:tRNA pseudouridine(38-40) synthase TruA [Bryobacterales bacterium]
MRRIRLELSYDGSAYSGWQVQPGLPTIQGELQRVLSRIEEAPVSVHGSGRTDAGVHALAQVAAFNLRNPIPTQNLQRAVNRLLPKDIRVNGVTEAAPGFHPRHDAVAKTYRYRIYREAVCPPFERFYVWHQASPLNEAAMERCARQYLGCHNFRAFAATDERYTPEADMHRSIFAITLERKGPLLVFEVRGSGFLKHMVRNLIGALVEVGVENLTKHQVKEMLSTGVRSAGIRTAPSSGLFLVNVNY